MKKIFVIIAAAIIAVLIIISACSCNKQLVDLTYSFDRAIISLPNGDVVEGEVSSWTDYDDGDQIQVKIDGKSYLVHSENIVLIAE